MLIDTAAMFLSSACCAETDAPSMAVNGHRELFYNVSKYAPLDTPTPAYSAASDSVLE